MLPCQIINNYLIQDESTTAEPLLRKEVDHMFLCPFWYLGNSRYFIKMLRLRPHPFIHNSLIYFVIVKYITDSLKPNRDL